MKNSKEYTAKFESFLKDLKKTYKKVEPVSFDNPQDALVLGIISEHLDSKTSFDVLKAMHEHFVDWNDLRVSRNEEVVEVLGGDNETNRKIATSLTAGLQAFIEKYDAIDFEALIEAGKRQAKTDLESIEGLSRYTVNFLMVHLLKAHSIPLTLRMIEFLKDNDLVHPDADNDDVNSFVERQVSAADTENFYYALRMGAEASGGKAKTKKAKAKKKTAKKK